MTDSTSKVYLAKANEIINVSAQLGLPLGWSLKLQDQETTQDPRNFPITAGGWILKGLGLLITGIAISQGSSIWFDVLGRLVNLRGSGGKPKSGTENGEGAESPAIRLEIGSSSIELPENSAGSGES